MTEKEVWKDIPKYEGYYQVSNLGSVKAIERVVCINESKFTRLKEHIMKQRKTDKGYMVVRLSKDGKANNKFVHVLVLESFCKRPYGLIQINHKDENKANNRLDNLEYCTSKYNSNYGTRAEMYRAKVINDKRRSKKISQLTLEGDFIRTFPSLREVFRVYGFQSAHIRSVANGKSKSAYGYKWQWA